MGCFVVLLWCVFVVGLVSGEYGSAAIFLVVLIQSRMGSRKLVCPSVSPRSRPARRCPWLCRPPPVCVSNPTASPPVASPHTRFPVSHPSPSPLAPPSLLRRRGLHPVLCTRALSFGSSSPETFQLGSPVGPPPCSPSSPSPTPHRLSRHQPSRVSSRWKDLLLLHLLSSSSLKLVRRLGELSGGMTRLLLR